MKELKASNELITNLPQVLAEECRFNMLQSTQSFDLKESGTNIVPSYFLV